MPDLPRVDRGGVAGERIAPTGDLTGDKLRFLRKRIGKSSKDFAQLVGVTSEQYSRIEGATLTASNDKLVRLMVIAMSVIGALQEPALR